MIKPRRLPVVREDRTIQIPLTKEHVAVIDWDDAWVLGGNWHALTTPTGHVYAHRGKHLLHRLVSGAPDDRRFDVDHKNGDTLNCRRNNLRVVTHSVNTWNRKLNANNKSGHTGVRELKGRWYANISGINLGGFSTCDEALAARLTAERELWGIQPRREFAHGVDVHNGRLLPDTRRYCGYSLGRLAKIFGVDDLV